jgi:pyridoxal 5'-phosphate synthase pdxS subunit
LRRINEGAALIRCKGHAGTGDIAEAVKHLTLVKSEIHNLKNIGQHKIEELAKRKGIEVALLNKVAKEQKLPVPFFAAGGIATPADAAFCMELGAESVFVGSGIFLSSNPAKRAKAIVEAVDCWQDPKKLAEISYGLGESMK